MYLHGGLLAGTFDVQGWCLNIISGLMGIVVVSGGGCGGERGWW